VKYTVKPTTRFQRDLKRLEKCGYNFGFLITAIKLLANGESLPASCNDRSPGGSLAGCRECRVQSDWLLIYEIAEEDSVLYLALTGTHSDIFAE
jgi:mRNA interferase YafQ